MNSLSSRREFLLRFAGTAAGLSTASVSSRFADPAILGASVPAALPSYAPDERYWEEVKARFPLKSGVLPMNAANLAPSPRSVVETMVATAWDLEGDVSHQNRAKFSTTLESARTRIASFLNASAEEIVIVRNASEANNTIVSGLTLGSGDEVVIFAQNHQTNSISWDVQAARYGFTVRRIGFEVLPRTPEEALALFVDAMGPRTRVITFSDVSNNTGLQLPTRAICQAAREREIYVHVDGAQTLGAVPRDMQELGCDSYSASAHKWLMGPKEVGILFVRAERVQQIWPNVVGVGWGNGAETSARGARKLESIGQRNDATIAGLVPTIDFNEEIGTAVISARIVELATLLKQGLQTVSGAQIVTPLSPELSGGVVVTTFPGRDTRSIYEALYNVHGIAGASTGGVRLCPHVYTTRADVERVVEAVGRASAA